MPQRLLGQDGLVARYSCKAAGQGGNSGPLSAAYLAVLRTRLDAYR